MRSRTRSVLHQSILHVALALVLFVGNSAAQTPPAGDPTVIPEEALCSGGVHSPEATTPTPALPLAERTAIAAHRSVAAPTPAPFPALLGPPCTAADFASLSGAPLVAAIANSSRACLGELWNFDGDVAQVIAGGNVDLVAAQIELDALDVATNLERLDRMSYFFQIAFFHEFYESSVTYSAASEASAQQALVTLGGNLDLVSPMLGPLALDLLDQWGISIDSTNATILLLPQVEQVLARYNVNPTLASSFQERVIAYHMLFSLARQIGNGASQGSGSPWYDAIPPSLFAEVETIALDLTYTSDSEYLVDNALWVISRFSKLNAATRAAAHLTMTTAYQTHVPYSLAWFRAVTDLEAEFAGVLSDGSTLDLDQIRADVRAIALPNEFTFDQGRLVFRTAISEALAEALYEAMQEVESQFFRKTNQTKPVPGDAQEILTLVIYGSPGDYATFQPFLYGLSTNNGGIFIESWATLFTYDRTPQQSIYTLEELLRHEYTHFLASRYLITGSFGEPGTLYDGSRLVWFDEGLAEYMAGSSRIDGILPRGILFDQIDGDSSRLSVPEIVNATYGGFTFYRYAGTFFPFLETERPQLFTDLFAVVRANDVVAFDALRATMESDASLQSEYDAYLTASIGQWQGGTGAFSENVPTTPTPPGLAVGNETSLRLFLESSLPAGGEFRVWQDRFRYRYSQTTANSGEPISTVREQIDASLDAQLVALEPIADNFLSTVAWFGELAVDATSASAEVIFEGPFRPSPSDITAPQAPTGLLASSAGGVVDLTWQENSEDDLGGYYVYRSPTPGGPYERVNAAPTWENSFTDPEAGAGTLTYVVTALDAIGNESGNSNEATIESTIEVLVINGYFDNGNSGYYNAYRSVLDTLGVAHTDWDPFTDGPITAALLADYTDGVVVWPCGYFNSSYPDQLGPARRALLTDYLDAGGRLLLSGAYVSLSLSGTELFDDYLHVDHVQHTVQLPGLLGVAGNAVGMGLQLDMTSGVYQSEVALSGAAEAALLYDPTSGAGTLQAAGVAASTIENGYRVAYLAFPFADLVATSRTVLLDRALDWLDPPSPCGVPFIRGDTNGNGTLDISDAIYLLSHLFGGGPPPLPIAESGDANGDGGVNIADVIFLLGYLFQNGPPPTAPFPTPGC